VLELGEAERSLPAAEYKGRQNGYFKRKKKRSFALRKLEIKRMKLY
jgi:hypothetical protein